MHSYICILSNGTTPFILPIVPRASYLCTSYGVVSPN